MMLGKALLTTPLIRADEMAELLSEALASVPKSNDARVSVENVVHFILTAIEEHFHDQVQNAIKNEFTPYSYYE